MADESPAGASRTSAMISPLPGENAIESQDASQLLMQRAEEVPGSQTAVGYRNRMATKLESGPEG